jgi:hypothetical protein
MNKFECKQVTLPHDGFIRGARSRKRERIPQGTTVYVLTQRFSRLYREAFLDKEQALTRMKDLWDAIDKIAGPNIEHSRLMHANFGDRIPTRVAKPTKPNQTKI